MILGPFGDACAEITESIRVWHQEGQRAPAPDSPATLDWSLDIDTMPWLVSGIEEADRHGLALFDAALNAFGDATRDPTSARDYLVVTAGLRVVVEACAQSHWLLARDLTALERLRRFGNLALEDLAYDDVHKRAVRSYSGIGKMRAGMEATAERRGDIVETLTRLTGQRPKGNTPDLYFGKPGSISARIETLFRPLAPSAKEAARFASMAYGVLSGPAHSSLGTIQVLYGPALADDQVVRERLLPPHQRVGSLLMTTGSALLQAQMSVADRYGWLDMQTRTTKAMEGLVTATLAR